MNNIKKLLSLFLAVLMIVSMAACNTGDNTDGEGPGDGPGASGGKVEHVINVKANGSRPLEDVDVQIYSDAELTDMVEISRTDEKGVATVMLPKDGTYYVAMSGLDAGYKSEKYYTFNGNTANVDIRTELVTGEDMSGAKFSVGDVMYDFEITDTDGNTIKMSELLAENDAVLLNFYFNGCSPCLNEVPYMEEAYQNALAAGKKIAMISINPMDGDGETEQDCKYFKESNGLSWPFAKVGYGWMSNASAYPTNIVVDRYGVVCMVETGSLPSVRPWNAIVDYFTNDDYEQKLLNSIDDIIEKIPPQYEDETPEDIAGILGDANGSVIYKNETEDEYTWPFIITEKDGEACLKASNSGYEATYSILYLEVTLEANQALAIDYLISSESGCDILHVIVDETPVFSISGDNEVQKWETCHPWVAQKAGTYQIGLTYIKDDSNNVGDDTAYIKNVRIIDADEIEVPTYLPHDAAVSENGFDYEYIVPVYNEQDGYYHVGTVDGPLLLANLMGVTQFNEENSVYLMALEGKFVLDGVDYTSDLVPYASYASNSKMSGYCTVDKGLADLLKLFMQINGFEKDNENEWLKVCKYYAAYGTNGVQMEDPIAGLATFSALKAELGYNEIPYLEGIPIMPRGKLAEFIPEKSGVYRITSQGTVNGFLSGWVFDDSKYHHQEHNPDGSERKPFYEYEGDERGIDVGGNVSMVLYMEAGRSYYIDIAFYDPYEVGVIPYTIEWVDETYDLFRLASPPYFTYNTDATGEAIYEIIHGGIDVVLGEDGYYYHDLGNGQKGSMIYADFTGTGFIDTPIADVPVYNADGTVKRDEDGNIVMIKGMISLRAFDFAYSEGDVMILAKLQKHGNDQDKVLEELREEWGTDYDYFYELYKVDEVFQGKYHGGGSDGTKIMESYLSKMIQGNGVDAGCVPVDAELAAMLQLAVNKYSFEDVDFAWLKLCYYYDYLGPQA